MNRTTRTALVAAILIAPVMVALPQRHQSATPSFEVASIKPNKDSAAGGPFMLGGGCRGVDSATPGAGGPPTQTTTIAIGGPPPSGGGTPFGGRVAGPAATPIGRCIFHRMTLKMLINAAYRLTSLGGSLDQLLTGGPGWIGTDQFDIEAKAEDPEHTSQDQLRIMLQNLLTERFKLKFHREQKETQGFDLLVAKGGLKMKEADGSEKNPGSMSMSVGNPASGGMSTINAYGSPMAAIISFLSGRLGRAIQDKTGLTGKYNFSLNWSPGDNETNALAGAGLPGGLSIQPAAGASEPGVSIFTALQEQMGLRLESSKVTIDAIVIDSVERPAEPRM